MFLLSVIAERRRAPGWIRYERMRGRRTSNISKLVLSRSKTFRASRKATEKGSNHETHETHERMEIP